MGRRRADCVAAVAMVGILDSGLRVVIERRAAFVVGAAMRRVDERSCFLANIMTTLLDN